MSDDYQLPSLEEARSGNSHVMTLDHAIVIAKDLARRLQESDDFHGAHAILKLIGVAKESPAYSPSLTLAKAMAAAVINDDEAAAMALADMLANNPTRKELNRTAELLQTRRMNADGREVYRWPEFQAFCDRLGVLWDLLTVDLTIMIPSYGPVKVIQSHHTVDNGPESQS